MITQIAITIDDFHEYIKCQGAWSARQRSWHIIDWGEETMSPHELFSVELSNKSLMRWLVEHGQLKYHSNSRPPVALDAPWILPWPEYDYYLSWQVPHSTDAVPDRLYHSQNRLLKPHRTELVRQLWETDQFRNGTVSYTQERTAEFKHNIVLPRGEHEWQDHVLGWLEPYEAHNPDMIVFMENNPPPPLQYWNRAAVNLVTETHWQYPNLTEKAYTSILWARPTLLIGSAGINSYLEQQGFRLLDSVYDYSFDSVHKLKKRVHGLVQQVVQGDPAERYAASLDTVRYNQRELIQRVAHTALPNILLDTSVEFTGVAARIKNNIQTARQQARDLL